MTPRKIVFATTGSLGDLHPFLAVGTAMHQRGYHVTVATAEAYRQRVEQLGLTFAPMRPDRPSDAKFHTVFMDRKTGPEFVFKHYLSPAIAQSYDDLLAATVGADLLVSQSLALAAPVVAEKTGIAWASAFFQPMTLSSIYDPPYLPPVPFIRWPVSWAQKWNEKILFYVKKYTLDWVRDVIALKAFLHLSTDKHPLYEDHHAPRLVLAMFSPFYGAPQPDWPANTVQTGIATLAQHGDPVTTKKLADFLNAGGAPLVFTLGSSSAENAGDFYAVALQAARQLGRRSILVTTGLSGQMDLPEGEDMLRIPYAPYLDMFAGAEAVIHAGGIATGFAALQCGKPQLIVPFAHDQIDNAARLQRLGVGRVIAREKYNLQNLTRVLRRVLTDKAIQAKAAAIAPVAAAEDGIPAACNALEGVLRDV